MRKSKLEAQADAILRANPKKGESYFLDDGLVVKGQNPKKRQQRKKRKRQKEYRSYEADPQRRNPKPQRSGGRKPNSGEKKPNTGGRKSAVSYTHPTLPDAFPFFGDKSFQETVDGCAYTSQTEALFRLLAGENVCLSGGAGAGKSYVIETFIRCAQMVGRKVAVTASTGIAASLIGGRTIHSWAGLGISEEPFNPRSRNFKKDYPHFWRQSAEMRKADVLIIDEISMLPAYLFTNLDLALQTARKDGRPFGGIQLVVCGDFLQLPPVQKSWSEADSRFAILCDSWSQADFHHLYLDRPQRSADPRLLNLLKGIVEDETVTEEDIRDLLENGRKVDDGYAVARLYTTNKNVEKLNNEKQALNPNPPREYKAKVNIHQPNLTKAAVLDFFKIEEFATFKKDDVVILTTNLNLDGLFLPNGSLGKVVLLGPTTVTVRFNSGKTVLIEPQTVSKVRREKGTVENGLATVKEFTEATVESLPLKLGYALTVHKSQGQTFDGVVVDLKQSFVPGLGYVALSRAKAFDSIGLLGYSFKAFQMSPKAKQIHRAIRKQALRLRGEFDYAYYAKKPHIARLLKMWDPETYSELPVEVNPYNVDSSSLGSSLKWLEDGLDLPPDFDPKDCPIFD